MTKINWQYILIVVVIAVVFGFGVLFLNRVWIPKELFLSAIRKPAPLPTEINQNFLTQVNECFIPTAKAYGYTLRITSGFRTQTEQDELFDQGRTEDGHIVSWAKPGRSLHNYGYAVDVVDRWRGYNVDWKKLKKIGEFCGLEQVDDPHFEHRSGLSVTDFLYGDRPPLLELPCEIMDQKYKLQEPLTLKDLNNCGIIKTYNN